MCLYAVLVLYHISKQLTLLFFHYNAIYSLSAPRTSSFKCQLSFFVHLVQVSESKLYLPSVHSRF